MKKGLKKLILSGAALAAVAATGATSTYAWYTTNTEVNANNISGASADAGNSSIYISADGGTTWFSKVDGDSTGSDKVIVSGADLTPVALKDNSGAAQWVDAKGQTVTTPSVLQFTLKIKAVDNANAVNVGIHSISIANTSSSIVLKENYLTGASYSCDILEALAFQITSDTTATAVSTHGYSLTPGQGCVTSADATRYNSRSGNGYANLPTVDAHAYVRAVTGDALSVTYDTTETTPFTADTKVCTCAAEGGISTLTFKVFLDGADVDCYDACRGQNFKFSINFTVLS